MRTLNVSLVVCIGAAVCMLIEGYMTWPTPFAKEPDTVAEIIHAYESGVIQQKSFDNVMRALGQLQE